MNPSRNGPRRREGYRSARDMRGDIAYHGVAFGYEEGRPVLTGIDLEVPSGKRIALVGLSGSGKTTLVRLLPRFYEPWAGSITIDGSDIRNYRRDVLRRNISIVLQDSILFEGTIRENIVLNRTNVSEAQLIAAAQQACIHDTIVDMPGGYDARVRELGKNFSSGQRQRIAIARAILRDAPILILDEPTANLDVEAEAEVMRAIDRLTAGRTVIVISHRLSTLGRVDEIAVLEGGRIVERGTYQQLKALGGSFAHLLAEQNRYAAEPVELPDICRGQRTHPGHNCAPAAHWRDGSCRQEGHDEQATQDRRRRSAAQTDETCWSQAMTASLRQSGEGRLVVVTGAAGFIGSWLCQALLADGWHVRGVDSFTPSYEPALKRGNIAGLGEDPGFEFVEADLAGADIVRLLDGAAAVVHLAAEGGASTSWEGSFARYVERNVLVTQQLLEVVDALPIQRFIYASSASVYGDADQPLSETRTPQPVNPYGASKLAAEHLVRKRATHGMPAAILRYFSVYGPRQRPDMAAHRFIEAALDGSAVTVYGDGAQTRDMTYVTDAVAATVAALSAPLEPGAVINVGTGQGVSVLQLISTIGELLGDGCLRVTNEPARDGDVARCEATIGTAGALLGWQPAVDLVTGLDHQILWHRSRRSRNGRAAHNGAHRSEPRGPRLMIYSQDGLGLGHLRRASSIATEFLKQEPAGWVLTTSDSPLGTLLRDIPNHDYLKLPSIVKSGPGDWHPLSLPLDFGHLRQLRSRLIHEAAMAFEPDVLLVDHMPHGAMGELLPVLDALRGGPTRVVLGLRDIIDAPQVVRQRWQAEGAYDALARYYDEVLIYGSQDVFDVCRAYEWPDNLAALVHYCGFVCTPQAPDDPKRMRARRLAGVPRGAMIAAMAGGGADAHELMSTLLDALPAINATRPVCSRS